MKKSRLWRSKRKRTTATLDFTARRVAAFLTDCIVLFGILAPTGYVLGRGLGISLLQTGPAVWNVILLNFSAPAWLYFIVSDCSTGGATFGKRLCKLRVARSTDEGISPGRAVVRTSIKLLPWELTHIFIFALSADPGRFGHVQWFGIAIVYALATTYLLVLLATNGEKTVHDLITDTQVINE